MSKIVVWINPLCHLQWLKKEEPHNTPVYFKSQGGVQYEMMIIGWDSFCLKDGGERVGWKFLIYFINLCCGFLAHLLIPTKGG